jgi:hypothetical protein
VTTEWRAQHVPAGQRVGDRAVGPHLGSGVGPVDPPDQVLELIQHRLRLYEQRGRVFGRLLALLEPGVRDDPGPELLNRRVASARSDSASASFTPAPRQAPWSPPAR